MKTIRHLLIAAIAILGLALLVPAVSAETLPGPDNPSLRIVTVPAEANAVILDLLLTLVERYPWIATLIAVLGSMRLWAKPACSAVYALIQITPSKWDDGIWAGTYRFLTEHWLGRILAYLADWLTSVKLPPPGPKQTLP